MKNVRLTKQGLPDLNYYGPRLEPKTALATEAANATDVEVVTGGDVVEAAAVPAAAPVAG